MRKEKITIQKVKNNPAGGVLIGKDKEGQTIIPKDGSLGGFLVGKLHKEGGIKAVNMGNGQPLEMQSNEVVITAPAVSDTRKNNFNGKMMTNRQILSQINVDGGGVSFADGGEVPKNIKRTGASYKYGGKTMTDHEIYKYITGGGSTILAPNGKPSNLNEKQYKLVRTPAFKKWFGDWEKDPDNASKVVDDNGEPMVVYHGTIRDFNVFDTKKSRFNGGIYFSSSKEFSKKFAGINGNVKDFFIKIINPVYSGFDGSGVGSQMSFEHRDGGIFTKRQTDNYGKKGIKEYIVGEPNQIKLADGTNTKFDTNNPDIRYEGGGHLAEGYSLREIASIHQVPLSELKEQVRLGMKAESEHTKSKREQMKIVKDHLFENPKYYTLLKKAGLKKGGEIQKESLVRDAKSGNTPARDLNNYNDMLDVEADGQVGGDTGIYADGGEVNSFLNYYFEELKDFLNIENNIDLKEDYSFFYKGENFTIEPIIISDINTSESIKEAIFIIYDIDDEIVGNIEFNPNRNKKFNANSEFFGWTNNKFKDGGEIENNLLDNQSFAEFKHSLEYVSKLDLTEKGNKNLAIDVQVEFFRWFVKEDLNSNLKSYYEAIEILPKNKREYCFELFDRDDLFEKLDKNVFYYLPDNLKKEPNIKKIDFAPTPSSENLAKITDLFTDKDMLRPIYSGVNFNLEDEEIEVTNAHILLLIKEKPHVSESGVYVIGKTKEWYLKKAENTKEDSDGLVKLEGKYPLVQRILPNEFDFVFSIDAEKFLRYANASEYFSNEYTNQIVIGFKTDDEHINSYGVNSNLLASCLKAMLMLGYNEIDVCLSESKNRAICLVPKGNSRKVSQRSLTTDLTLLMPLRLDGNESIMDNIYDLENDMPSTRKIMLDKQVEESVLEQENNIIELEPIEVEKNESNQIREAIEVLELLSETAEGEDKKEIEEAIEILKMLLETSSYELGGKILKDDFTFRKIETPLN
jgi:hypothetical protein